MKRFVSGVLVGVAVSMVAQLSAQQYSLYGKAIVTPCRAWAQGKTTEQQEWVLGCVSGAGFLSATSLKPIDQPGILALVDKYCAAQPAENVSRAP